MKYIAREIKSGIYKIENTVNGKVYVGQTKDLHKRKLEHFASLRTNKHHNAHLQSAFNKYGEEYFRFSVVEECGFEDLNDKEIYWINKLKAIDDQCGYNLSEGGVNSGTFKKKVVCLNNGKIFPSIKDAAQHYNISSSGIINCCSHKTKYSGIIKNIPLSWWYWEEYITLSEESIKELRKNIPNLTKKRIPTYINYVVLLNTLEIFDNLIEAADAYNISSSSIGQCCRKKTLSAGKDEYGNKLYWMYLNEYNKLSSVEKNKISNDINNNMYNIPFLPNCKKVVLLNTGEIFLSMTAAANKYNISISSVHDCCEHIHDCGGHNSLTKEKYVWAYYDEYINLSAKEIKVLLQKPYRYVDRSHKVMVVLLNTGEVFNSTKEAANKYSIAPSHLTASCKKRRCSAGKDKDGKKLYWAYYDECKEMTKGEIYQLYLKRKETPPIRRTRKVVLLNNNTVFNSIKEAAQYYGVLENNIIAVCKNYQKTCGRDPITGERLRWMYYDEYLKAKPNGDESIA